MLSSNSGLLVIAGWLVRFPLSRLRMGDAQFTPNVLELCHEKALEKDRRKDAGDWCQG